MRINFALLVLLLSLGLLALGCKGSNQSYNDNQAQKSTEDKLKDSVKGAENAISDAEITASVKAKFMTDENVAARHIDVATNNGIVTLRGKVSSETEADRAIELAKTADGVRLVHSYLKTDLAENETDQDSDHKLSDTANKVEDKLRDAGHSVENGLDHVSDAGSDAAITAQIKWKLAKDKLVQASDINVETKNKRVTLSGTVNSKQELKRAIQLARSVDDVVAVNSDLHIR
jgi:hyperosmotically inducible protein